MRANSQQPAASAAVWGNPDAPLRRAWWHLLHAFCYAWFALCYRHRAWGSPRIPRKGPVLYVSNHQSFFDPIIVGLAAHQRAFHALARSSLFGHRVFAWLIRSLNAIPVERGSSDMAAMRKCIDVLQAGHALMIFPEGTRTPDGSTQAFASGMMLLIKRGRPRVVPVAIEGAYDIWPRWRKGPRLTGRVGVMYGHPIEPDTLIQMGPEGALEHLRQTVETMRQDVAKRIATDEHRWTQMGISDL
ncbi:MAG: lysophospholipid acyltransferase family protein [Phycisphaeraceae bacterium]